MSGATHLRGIAIAGALAALALAGVFITLAMNQDASKAATPPTILPLKDRHTAAAKIAPKVTPTTTTTTTTTAAKKVAPKPKPVDPNLKAALAAGLPKTIAEGFAKSPVVVVALSSDEDSVSQQATAEAKEGAQFVGAAFVSVDVDTDSTTVQTLARVLDEVPDAPATLIYIRPATLALTLTGYVDETVIEQAAANADPSLLAPPETVSDWAHQANVVCTTYITTMENLGATRSALFTKQEGKETTDARDKLVAGIQVIPTPAGHAGAQVKQLNQLLTKDDALTQTEVNAEVKGDLAASAKTYHEQTALEKQEANIERPLGANACAGVG